MADAKLSALTEVTTLANANQIYANVGGVSKRITAANAGVSLLANAGVTVSVAEINQINSLSDYNVIINGDFRINQRAYVSAATLASGSYGHDRWKAGATGGDYSFTQLASSTVITIAAGKTLIQVVEDKNVAGGTYTVSWTGTAQARGGVDSDTPSGAYADSPITLSSQTAGTVMSVEFDDGTLSNIQVDNLPNGTTFTPRQYTDEYDMCLRYFCLLGIGATGYISLADTIEQGVVFPQEMRADPTVALTTTTPNIRWRNNTIAGSGSTIVAQTISTRGARVKIDGFSALVVGEGAIISEDAILSASSEL